MSQAVQDTLTIRIVDEDKEPKQPKTKSAPTPGDKGGKKNGEGPPAATHGLPHYRLLTRDGHPVGDQETLRWPEGFTELDGGLIEDLGDQGVVYKINYDNTT